MIPSAHDRRVIRRVTLALNLRRAWEDRGWWTQIMAGAAVVCVAELLVIYGLYPWLLKAVQL